VCGGLRFAPVSFAIVLRLRAGPGRQKTNLWNLRNLWFLMLCFVASLPARRLTRRAELQTSCGQPRLGYDAAMRWLLYGNLAPAVGEALRRHGHTASTPAELNIETTDLSELLEAAGKKQVDVLTNDADLANVPFAGGSAFKRSLVFLQLEGGEVEQDDAVDRLFQRYKRLSPRRLYTVTGTRVKVRQLPDKSA
jgi:hypothetical protein